MSRYIFIILLSLFSFTIHAQQISGEVCNANNVPVELATIVLQTPDSVYAGSAYTDSLGRFMIHSDLKAFRLIIQHLMYQPFEGEYTRQDIGTLHLQENEHHLGEVIVSGERPAVRVIDGKMTYDLSRLVEDKVVSNAYESLLQLPGVREQDDRLVLAGANSLTVLLNGKPTTMTNEQLINLLKNTPKEQIEKAEIMYSAPPQYHTRGAAINLVLQKGISETPHWQGQVNSMYNQRYYDNYSLGSALLYSSSKLSLDFLYSFAYNRTHSETDQISHHLFDGEYYDITQDNTGSGRSQDHTVRIGADYNIDDKNKVHLTSTNQIIPVSKRMELSEGTYSHSENRKNAADPIRMHNLELGYTSGFGLNTGIDYTYYKNHAIQDFTEKAVGKENRFEAYANQNINRLMLYADQTHPVSKGGSLNYGGKFLYASDDSRQTYHSLAGGDLSDLNTASRLNEYTYDLYAGFNKSFTEQFSFSASLTGEYYRLGSFDEWTLFPQMEATYVFSPSQILQFSFSSDKVYPDYWEMQGAVSYLNGYGEVHGNPLLKPYKDYNAQLNYIIKGKYILTAFYNYQDDYFVQLPYQAPDRLALIYQTTNFDYKQQAGLSLVIPFAVGNRWDSRLSLVGFYDKVRNDHFHDIAFRKDNLSMYSQWNNTVHLSTQPDIQFELNGIFTTRNIQGPMEIHKLYRVDAGLKWTFAGDKAELRLKATDLFDNWHYNIALKHDHQDFKMNPLPDLRAVQLSFAYKFGGYKDKKRKEVDTSRFGNQ